MIYCNLKGGLGNMLFQIAASNAFSIEKNTECSFPNFDEHIRFLNNDNYYNSKLKHAEEYKNFLNLSSKKPIGKINLYKYPFHYTNKIPNEDEFWIDGFFQSEKYFNKYRNEIIELIKPTEEIQNYIKIKYSSYLTSSTSIHIRRGDYLNLSNHHPPQSLEYYMKCINDIAYDNLLIFSDDIKWCKENIKLKNILFVENEKDYIELFLMSKCNINIISNSSFSWWGAWLNDNEDKKVYAPKNWFGKELSHIDISDIVPEKWIKV
jgi:hypothetical protein